MTASFGAVPTIHLLGVTAAAFGRVVTEWVLVAGATSVRRVELRWLQRGRRCGIMEDVTGAEFPEDDPWLAYAERWGTDHYNEGFWTPRREMVANYGVWVLLVLTFPLRILAGIWSVLFDLGLVK